MLFEAMTEDALRLVDVSCVAVTSRAFDAVDHKCSTRDLPHSVLKWEELADFVGCSEGQVEVDFREELVDVCLKSLRESFDPLRDIGEDHISFLMFDCCNWLLVGLWWLFTLSLTITDELKKLKK
jgi:hypothetical protein